MKGVDNTIPGAPVTCNFHTSFVDPTAPAQDEDRKSCEHRVQVYFKQKQKGFGKVKGRFGLIKKSFDSYFRFSGQPPNYFQEMKLKKQEEIKNEINDADNRLKDANALF